MNPRDLIARWVLGDLTASEARQAQELAENSREMAALAERLRGVANALRSAGECEPWFATRVEQRARLYELAPAKPKAPFGERLAEAVGAVLALLRSDSWADSGVPAGVRGADGSRTVSLQHQGVEIELRFVPSSTRLKAYECVGQVRGGAVERVEWTEVHSGVSHTLAPDDLGFFDVEISAGEHQVDALIDGVVVRSPAIMHPPEGDA